MSKFGYEIRNIEAASLYYYNRGLRSSYDYTTAMLSNSLLKDYLDTAGISTWHGEGTLDVICLEFGYGTRSYQEEVTHLDQSIKLLDDLEELTEEEKAGRKKRFEELKAFAEANSDKFIKISKE